MMRWYAICVWETIFLQSIRINGADRDHMELQSNLNHIKSDIPNERIHYWIAFSIDSRTTSFFWRKIRRWCANTDFVSLSYLAISRLVLSSRNDFRKINETRERAGNSEQVPQWRWIDCRVWRNRRDTSENEPLAVGDDFIRVLPSID